MKTLKLFRNFSEKTFYEVLGVSQTASKDEIKAAYLKLAKKFHPDSQEGDEEKFKDISKAYQVLKSEEERENYNKLTGKVEKGKKKGMETKSTHSSQGFHKRYEQEFFASKWSGGGFKEAKKSEMQDLNIKPGDVFVKMGMYAVGASAIFLIGYIIVLVMTPVPGREKVERPEGVVTKMPERRPAKVE